MNRDLAIKVENVSKTFRIPREKISSLKGAFVNMFRSNAYEEFKALDSVSFEVKKGEFFGIIGRNGSGKSTLLKILAGIYQPDGGKVKINGRISPFLELGIGFNPELSGRDNIYLNATVLGLTKKQIDEKFDDIVEFSELRRFIDQKIKNYSSGMQVRLAFSVAIYANRDILLMDEVLAVGDLNFQSKCLEEFNRYREQGKTVILVTHNMQTVEQYCDRVMLLRNGKIESIGDPDEVGNTYIDQNMMDEGMRMEGSEKRLAEQRQTVEGQKNLKKMNRDDKLASITQVDFLDAEGNSKNIFETGSEMSVRVYFQHSLGEEEPLNFGVAMYSQDNKYIIGTNTFIDKTDTTEFRKRGYFRIRYNKMPVKDNSYFVKVGLYGESDKKNYDLLNKSKFFKFVSRSRSHGLVEIEYNWI